MVEEALLTPDDTDSRRRSHPVTPGLMGALGLSGDAAGFFAASTRCEVSTAAQDLLPSRLAPPRASSRALCASAKLPTVPLLLSKLSVPQLSMRPRLNPAPSSVDFTEVLSAPAAAPPTRQDAASHCLPSAGCGRTGENPSSEPWEVRRAE